MFSNRNHNPSELSLRSLACGTLRCLVVPCFRHRFSAIIIHRRNKHKKIFYVI